MPKQTPVTDPGWTISGKDRDVVMGIDPGLATLGVVILVRERGQKPWAQLVTTIQTKKAEKKARTNLRVTTDDQRRYMEIWKQLEVFHGEYRPHAVGVEGYRVFQGAGGNAWKTAVVYGGIIFWAHTRGLYVAPFLPTDLKKRFTGKMSASKTMVETAICELVDGLEEGIQAIPKTKREHVGDAAGHAYLVMEELDEHRKLLGI